MRFRPIWDTFRQMGRHQADRRCLAAGSSSDWAYSSTLKVMVPLRLMSLLRPGLTCRKFPYQPLAHLVQSIH
jgi:hypothetical protein